MFKYEIQVVISEEDFELGVGRRPRHQKEFLSFCCYCEKGLLNGHIDWDILFDCAREELER